MPEEEYELFGQSVGAEQEQEAEGSGDFWLTDSIEGIGLGVLGAVEGIFELGTLIPGIDYDIPDNFGLGHADTGMGRFIEGMSTFMVPFLVPGAGWVSGGMKLGKGIQLLSTSSRLARGAGKVKGGAYALGKHIAGKKLGLNKKIAPWRDRLLLEKATLQNASGYLNKGRASLKGGQAALVGHLPEAAGAMIGGAMVDFTVWDPQEARLSNMIEAVPGLSNPVTQFLQMDEEDSKLTGRIKQMIEGAGLGLFVDSFIGGIKGMHRARRVFKSTGSGVKAQRAFRSEVIENNIARRQAEFGGTREETIMHMTADLGIDPHAISWGATTEEAEKIFFQVERSAVPKHLRGLLAPDDLSKLNLTAMKEVDRLINTALDGGIEPRSIDVLARAGASVRGEYERMGRKILPKLFPAQKDLGRNADDGQLWTAINAILSPNQAVDVHTGASMAILSAWRGAGRPTETALINRLIQKSLKKTGVGGKNMKGLTSKYKTIVELLSKTDELTPKQILDMVDTELKKTRQFAGSYEGGRYAGIALDVHMGHILDPSVWKTIDSLYGKQKATVKDVGAMAYRGLLRKAADDLGFKSGTEVQESVWASIASIKGLLSHFRGNIDDVMDNMHGENISQMWDHNVVMGDLLANKRFEDVLRAGGATDEMIASMKGGTGDFAPRKPQPGVVDVDRAAMREAIERIQRWTEHGANSGQPQKMKTLIQDMAEKALKTIGFNAPGLMRKLYKGTGARATEVVDIEARGGIRELPKTQAAASMESVPYGTESALPTPHGLPDTYRTRPEVVAPRKTEVKKSVPEKYQDRVAMEVDDGRAVSIAYDNTPAQILRTTGGGKVLSAKGSVTLTDVSFDVAGKGPQVKGKVSSKPVLEAGPGKGKAALGNGVEVTYNGEFFVTGNGYAIRTADEVSMVGDKIFARGDVRYWTKKAAFGKEGRPGTRAKVGDERTISGRADAGPSSPAKKGAGRLGKTKFLFQTTPEGGTAKGVTLMDEMGRIYIKALQNADASTGFHETIHAWRLLHANRAISEADRVAAGGLLDIEIEVLEKALGMKKGAEWRTKDDELLADWWERYILDGEVSRTGASTERDFDILTVALTKMSRQQRKIYDGIESTLPEGAIPEELRNIFDAAINRSDVQGVMDSLGAEARAVYDGLTIGGKSTASAVKDELTRFEKELDIDYPNWHTEEGYKALPHGQKVKLGRRRAAVNRQLETAETAAGGAESRATAKDRAERELQDVHADMDSKYPDGWNDKSLEPEDLAAVRGARDTLNAIETGEVPFASRTMEPEGPRTERTPKTGFPEAERRGDGPININRAVGTMDDVASGDDARDLLEQYVREEEDWLKGQKEADRADIEAREVKHYEDLAAAARKGGKGDISQFFKTATENGRRFIAKSRAIRSFAADVFSSAEDAAARLEAARDMGRVDKQAQADFLYYTGLFDPLTEQLNTMAHQMGFGLAGMRAEPWGQVLNRAVDADTVEMVLRETTQRLQAARGGDETVEKYIDRMLVAMKEGQMSMVSAASTVKGDKLDIVLEVFYNSILSGPRTHAVNTLSNAIYGTTLHIERRFGRAAMRMLGNSEDFPKTIGTVVGIREMLKDSFRLAKIAFREASSQFDPAGGRATFDKAKGVYAGRVNRDYAGRLGAKNMPEPFRSALNAMLNITAVGGYPVRLLGSMDELFKQMHSRVIVQEELARKAAKMFPDDPTAMAKYIREEFDMIIGEGNHYTKKRVKYDGLKEAYAKGMNKTDARRYAEEYVGRVWGKDRSAVADRALDFARRSTFTHPNAAEVGQNPVSRQVQKVGNALSAASQQVRWLRFMAPFINTPTNLLSEATDHLMSPLFDGVVPGYRALKRIIKGGVDDATLRGTPDERADALGRLAVSSSVISLVWMKVNSGEITGGGPKDPAALRLLRGAGWQPYSVRFGESYYGYGRLDPLASVVGIVADIAEGMNGNPYTDDPENSAIESLLMGTTMALFRNLSEKSYLSGIINFASALDNPEYYGKAFAHNLGGSIIPNISAQVAGDLDSTSREIRGIVDKWKARVPFMGDNLLPKRNFMGEEEKRIQYAGGPLLGLLSPVPYSQVSDDVIRREVTKFGEVIGPPSATKYGSIDLREYAGVGNQTAYDRYQELQGTVTREDLTLKQSLTDMINGSDYNQLPDAAGDGGKSPKMDLIRKTVGQYRKTAWSQLLEEFPLLRDNFNITLYNRQARRSGRAERDLLSLIK